MKTILSTLIALSCLLPNLASAAAKSRELMAHQTLNQDQAAPGETLSLVYLKVYVAPNSDLFVPAGTPIQIEYVPDQETAAVLKNSEPQTLEFMLAKDLHKGSVAMFTAPDRAVLLDGHGTPLKIQIREDISIEEASRAFLGYSVTVKIPSMEREFAQGYLKFSVRGH